MALTLSTSGSAAVAGQVIQVVTGFNTTTTYQVFQKRNQWSHVPGGLMCSFTPEAVGNKVYLEAKFLWGGFRGANESGGYDCAAGFRFAKLTPTKSWTTISSPGGNVVPGSSGQNVVGCGNYRYAWDADTTNGNQQNEYMNYVDTIEEEGVHKYAVFWTCLYEGSRARTIMWNRAINYGNSYNPITTCSIVATEVKV